MDHRRLFRGDCGSCQGLCCASLPFDRSEWFGFSKPADVPCPHLEPSHDCGIHRQLRASGFAGCADYDCLGAGQRVTRELFPGAIWRTSPQLAGAMFAAFRQLKHVHELRLLLREAAALKLEPAHAERCQALLTRLEPEPGFTAETLAQLDVPLLDEAVHALLRSLERYVAQRRRLPLVK